MNKIELVNQLIELTNNAKDLFFFCSEHHLFNFIGIGTFTLFKKKSKKESTTCKRKKKNKN